MQSFPCVFHAFTVEKPSIFEDMKAILLKMRLSLHFYGIACSILSHPCLLFGHATVYDCFVVADEDVDGGGHIDKTNDTPSFSDWMVVSARISSRNRLTVWADARPCGSVAISSA